MSSYAREPGEPSDPVWVAVPGYEGYYEVSDLGGVRSVDRLVGHPAGTRRALGQMLHPSVAHGTGYLRVNLTDPADSRRRTRHVHTLVLTAFMGTRPDGAVACHCDGDRTNNRLSNLRWDTPASNNADTVRHGTHRQASRTHCPRGHEYDGANTFIGRRANGRTFRKCRTCHNANISTRRARLRARL